MSTFLIKTPRLSLREATLADAAFMLELLNSPGWLQYIGDRDVHTVEAAERYIAERMQAPYAKFGFGMWMVELAESALPIGICGLVSRPTLQHPDLGFAFLPAFGGHGYAFEAANATLHYAHEALKITPLLAIITPDNERSISLVERLGFKLEGTMTAPREDIELLLFRKD